MLKPELQKTTVSSGCSSSSSSFFRRHNSYIIAPFCRPWVRIVHQLENNLLKKHTSQHQANGPTCRHFVHMLYSSSKYTTEQNLLTLNMSIIGTEIAGRKRTAEHVGQVQALR